MSLDQILIVIVGVFVAGIGIMWLLDLRKKGQPGNLQLIAIGLSIVGIVILSYPWWNSAGINQNDASNKPAASVNSGPRPGDPGTKEIVIGEDFIKNKIKQDTAYARYVASQWYAEAVQKWNNNIFKYDSVDLVIEQLNKSLDFFELAQAHEALGQAYVQKGLMKQGVVEYTKAIEMDPNLGAAYFNRGTAYYIMGRSDLYCQDWIKALELGVPNAVEATRTYCGL